MQVPRSIDAMGPADARASEEEPLGATSTFLALCSCCCPSGTQQAPLYADWSSHPATRKYRVLRHLGQGGFSEVLLAEELPGLAKLSSMSSPSFSATSLGRPSTSVLGRASHGSALARTRSSAASRAGGRLVALKVLFLNRPGLSAEQCRILAGEATILRMMAHPNIIRCFEVYTTQRQLVMVLEHLQGGELLDHLRSLHCYSEAKAAQIFRQVMEAVAYMHSLGIMHRDIKPENLLFPKPPEHYQAKGVPPKVRLIDLGMAGVYRPEEPQRGCLGSPGFISPEVVRGGKHTPAMDIYSCGVLLFILLTGRKPWNHSQVDNLEYGMMRLAEAPGLKDERFTHASAAAQQLVQAMMADKAAHRPTAEQVLRHAWLCGADGAHDHVIDQAVQQRLGKLMEGRRSRGTATGLIACPHTGSRAAAIAFHKAVQHARQQARQQAAEAAGVQPSHTSMLSAQLMQTPLQQSMTAAAGSCEQPPSQVLGAAEGGGKWSRPATAGGAAAGSGQAARQEQEEAAAGQLVAELLTRMDRGGISMPDPQHVAPLGLFTLHREVRAMSASPTTLHLLAQAEQEAQYLVSFTGSGGLSQDPGDSTAASWAEQVPRSPQPPRHHHQQIHSPGRQHDQRQLLQRQRSVGVPAAVDELLPLDAQACQLPLEKLAGSCDELGMGSLLQEARLAAAARAHRVQASMRRSSSLSSSQAQQPSADRGVGHLPSPQLSRAGSAAAAPAAAGVRGPGSRAASLRSRPVAVSIDGAEAEALIVGADSVSVEVLPEAEGRGEGPDGRGRHPLRRASSSSTSSQQQAAGAADGSLPGQLMLMASGSMGSGSLHCAATPGESAASQQSGEGCSGREQGGCAAPGRRMQHPTMAPTMHQRRQQQSVAQPPPVVQPAAIDWHIEKLYSSELDAWGPSLAPAAAEQEGMLTGLPLMHEPLHEQGRQEPSPFFLRNRSLQLGEGFGDEAAGLPSALAGARSGGPERRSIEGAGLLSACGSMQAQPSWQQQPGDGGLWEAGEAQSGGGGGGSSSGMGGGAGEAAAEQFASTWLLPAHHAWRQEGEGEQGQQGAQAPPPQRAQHARVPSHFDWLPVGGQDGELQEQPSSQQAAARQLPLPGQQQQQAVRYQPGQWAAGSSSWGIDICAAGKGSHKGPGAGQARTASAFAFAVPEADEAADMIVGSYMGDVVGELQAGAAKKGWRWRADGREGARLAAAAEVSSAASDALAQALSGSLDGSEGETRSFMMSEEGQQPRNRAVHMH